MNKYKDSRLMELVDDDQDCWTRYSWAHGCWPHSAREGEEHRFGDLEGITFNLEKVYFIIRDIKANARIKKVFIRGGSQLERTSVAAKIAYAVNADPIVVPKDNPDYKPPEIFEDIWGNVFLLVRPKVVILCDNLGNCPPTKEAIRSLPPNFLLIAEASNERDIPQWLWLFSEFNLHIDLDQQKPITTHYFWPDPDR